MESSNKTNIELPSHEKNGCIQAKRFGFHHGINHYKLLQFVYKLKGQLEDKVFIDTQIGSSEGFV
jgi:hypothetical protein